MAFWKMPELCRLGSLLPAYNMLARSAILLAMPSLPTPPKTHWPVSDEIEAHQERNLLLLALHQIVFRVGWLFKTESVIMPAFVDHVAGAGWIRGCLPVLGRLGQSIPPVFAAGRVKTLGRRKELLAVLTCTMSLPLGVLAGACWLGKGTRGTAMVVLFLAMYLLFFVINGLYQLCFGTMQGKLIEPTRRGRLLWMSTFWGVIPATLIAWWLLPDWIESPKLGWQYIFGFAAVSFFVSGLIVLLLAEPRDPEVVSDDPIPGGLAETWSTLRRDANLRRLILIGMLFGSALLLVPHYQAMARQRLDSGGSDLVGWIITQSIAVSLLSLVVGPLADRRGYRLTLRVLVFGSILPPISAMALTHLPGMAGRGLFWLVFIPLGITPLVLRAVLNYALEIAPPTDQARYLSIVNLGIACPFLLSPGVGWLIDQVGFERVFCVVILLVLTAGGLTFRLTEPRLGIKGEEHQPLDPPLEDA